MHAGGLDSEHRIHTTLEPMDKPSSKLGWGKQQPRQHLQKKQEQHLEHEQEHSNSDSITDSRDHDHDHELPISRKRATPPSGAVGPATKVVLVILDSDDSEADTGSGLPSADPFQENRSVIELTSELEDNSETGSVFEQEYRQQPERQDNNDQDNQDADNSDNQKAAMVTATRSPITFSSNDGVAILCRGSDDDEHERQIRRTRQPTPHPSALESPPPELQSMSGAPSDTVSPSSSTTSSSASPSSASSPSSKLASPLLSSTTDLISRSSDTVHLSQRPSTPLPPPATSRIVFNQPRPQPQPQPVAKQSTIWDWVVTKKEEAVAKISESLSPLSASSSITTTNPTTAASSTTATSTISTSTTATSAATTSTSSNNASKSDSSSSKSETLSQETVVPLRERNQNASNEQQRLSLLPLSQTTVQDVTRIMGQSKIPSHQQQQHQKDGNLRGSVTQSHTMAAEGISGNLIRQLNRTDEDNDGVVEKNTADVVPALDIGSLSTTQGLSLDTNNSESGLETLTATKATTLTPPTPTPMPMPTSIPTTESTTENTSSAWNTIYNSRTESDEMVASIPAHIKASAPIARLSRTELIIAASAARTVCLHSGDKEYTMQDKERLVEYLNYVRMRGLLQDDQRCSAVKTAADELILANKNHGDGSSSRKGWFMRVTADATMSTTKMTAVATTATINATVDKAACFVTTDVAQDLSPRSDENAITPKTLSGSAVDGANGKVVDSVDHNNNNIDENEQGDHFCQVHDKEGTAVVVERSGDDDDTTESNSDFFEEDYDYHDAYLLGGELELPPVPLQGDIIDVDYRKRMDESYLASRESSLDQMQLSILNNHRLATSFNYSSGSVVDIAIMTTTVTVKDVRVSYSNKFLYSGADDGKVIVWDADNGDLIERIDGHTRGPINRIAVSEEPLNNEDLFATCSSGGVNDEGRVCRTNRPLQVGHNRCVSSLAFGRGYFWDVLVAAVEGNYVACGTSGRTCGSDDEKGDGIVHIYDVRTTLPFQQAMTRHEDVNLVDFSPCENYIISCSHTNETAVFDRRFLPNAKEYRPLHVFKHQDSESDELGAGITSALWWPTFNQRGLGLGTSSQAMLLTGGGDGCGRLWDLRRATEDAQVWAIDGKVGPLARMVGSPDLDHLVFGGDTGAVNIFTIDQGIVAKYSSRSMRLLDDDDMDRDAMDQDVDVEL
ncbi:hypothetical protein BG004_000520 [Podila humilis]|nr:hypothetical protein BG004_000520 [Podila humilis]